MNDDKITKVIIEIDTAGLTWKNGNFAYEFCNLLQNKILRDLNDSNHGPHLWSRYCDSNGNACCHITFKFDEGDSLE